MVIVSHHKTGTALAGCFVSRVIISLARLGEKQPVSAYVNSFLTSEKISLYLRATRVLTNEYPYARVPYLILKTGNSPLEVCAGEELSQGTSVPQRCAERGLQNDCPCYGNATNCLSIGNCVQEFPVNSNITWVHLIRHPLDTVISAFYYHTREVSPETWLHETKITDVAEWLIRMGIPIDLLEHIGALNAHHLSYRQFLLSLPASQGLLLEFLRSSIDLWQMARLYQRLMHLPNAIILRFESFQLSFAASAEEWLLRMPLPCTAKRTCLENVLDDVSKHCNMRHTGRSLTPRHEHVHEHNSTVRDSAAQMLMLVPFVRDQVCLLERILGYVSKQTEAAHCS